MEMFLKSNVFAYGLNNPITNIDPDGFWVMSILGFTFQAGGGIAFSVSVWWVIDGKGNSGLLVTAVVGVGSPSASFSWSPFFSWKRTIFDLKGLSYSVGGSGGVGISAGADMLFDDDGPIGIQLNLGFGASPGEGHFLRCVTGLVSFGKIYNPRWQIYSTIRSVKNMIWQLYS